MTSYHRNNEFYFYFKSICVVSSVRMRSSATEYLFSVCVCDDDDVFGIMSVLALSV